MAEGLSSGWSWVALLVLVLLRLVVPFSRGCSAGLAVKICRALVALLLLLALGRLLLLMLQLLLLSFGLPFDCCRSGGTDCRAPFEGAGEFVGGKGTRGTATEERSSGGGGGGCCFCCCALYAEGS